MTTGAEIVGVYTGQPESLWDGRDPSAIRKSPTGDRVEVTETGIIGDRQADLAVHGGPDKALHIYPSEHYAHWRGVFPEHAQMYRPGGFGENISCEGFSEEDLCIGDIFDLGTARVQISQGRQPCWKLNMHTGNPAQAAAFQKTGMTGWYFRVLEPGRFQAGDRISLSGRPCPDWTLRDVILARFNTGLDPAVARALSELAELASPWRTAFARKAESGYSEDTAKRLEG
ncbi:MOSC domain-containing protein [Labrenzia sp. 011]|uniref:MOSC domain-containing protein n=1 Tax=Labrenzia sp. 011 TaxID=2171494 RepID=UPI000D50E93F|nr:MOSC domain-containing protein [Labrenzia sp. 011]PVB60319.1 MOSC domain-containing protein [Labrenzia sp. 011]